MKKKEKESLEKKVLVLEDWLRIQKKALLCKKLYSEIIKDLKETAKGLPKDKNIKKFISLMETLTK
jgi:hypothetical protein